MLVSANSSQFKAKIPVARVTRMTFVNKIDGYAEDTDMVFSIHLVTNQVNVLNLKKNCFHCRRYEIILLFAVSF